MNLNELNLDSIGDWPKAAKALLIGISALVILGFVYFFDIKPLQHKIELTKNQENELKTTYKIKYSQAVTYPLYQTQVKTLQSKINAAIAKLPDKIDIPGLIEDISKMGIQSGLNFNYIKPKAEIRHQQYLALPIEISLTGTYLQINQFIGQLSRLSRIIIIEDFHITHVNDQNNSAISNLPLVERPLKMELTAITYQKQANFKKTTTNEGTP